MLGPRQHPSAASAAFAVGRLTNPIFVQSTHVPSPGAPLSKRLTPPLRCTTSLQLRLTMCGDLAGGLALVAVACLGMNITWEISFGNTLTGAPSRRRHSGARTASITHQIVLVSLFDFPILLKAETFYSVRSFQKALLPGRNPFTVNLVGVNFLFHRAFRPHLFLLETLLFNFFLKDSVFMASSSAFMEPVHYHSGST
jgi:hypothetical protein